MNKTEIWKSVVGFETSYEVSNKGRVRSKTRVVINCTGVTRTLKGKLLHLVLTNGYRQVNLGRGNTRKVHILVLEAFVGPRQKGQGTRHLNDKPNDNKLSNLVWGTQSENMYDVIRNKKKRVGEAWWNAKLTRKSVRFIRKNAHVYSFNEMGRMFNVSAGVILKVIERQTWKHVT